MKPRKPMAVEPIPERIEGRRSQVDLCPGEAGYVLSLGPVSLWLDREAAADVVATLTRALAIEADSHPNLPGLRSGRTGATAGGLRAGPRGHRQSN
jgi:hypothetical protein